MRGGVDGGNLKDFAIASSSSTQTCRAWCYKYKNVHILDSINDGCEMIQR